MSTLCRPNLRKLQNRCTSIALFGIIMLALGCLRAPAQAVHRNGQPILWYGSIPSSNRFVVALLPILPRTVALTSKGALNGRHKWTERDHGMTAPVASNTLSVNIFTSPGKAMVGERPKPFGEAFGFDPITSTLIFGEHDAVLVDAMTTVAEAEALADWVALHNRNLETIYITHAHFDHFYGLGILLDRFPGARAIATPKTVKAMQMSFTPTVERLARRLFPGQVPTKLVAPAAYERDTFTLEGQELRIIEQGRTDSA